MDLLWTQQSVINTRGTKGLNSKEKCIPLIKVNMEEELCDLGMKILLRIMKHK